MDSARVPQDREPRQQCGVQSDNSHGNADRRNVAEHNRGGVASLAPLN
jgi:hypothetical protein